MRVPGYERLKPWLQAEVMAANMLLNNTDAVRTARIEMESCIMYCQETALVAMQDPSLVPSSILLRFTQCVSTAHAIYAADKDLLQLPYVLAQLNRDSAALLNAANDEWSQSAGTHATAIQCLYHTGHVYCSPSEIAGRLNDATARNDMDLLKHSQTESQSSAQLNSQYLAMYHAQVYKSQETIDGFMKSLQDHVQLDLTKVNTEEKAYTTQFRIYKVTESPMTL